MLHLRAVETVDDFLNADTSGLFDNFSGEEEEEEVDIGESMTDFFNNLLEEGQNVLVVVEPAAEDEEPELNVVVVEPPAETAQTEWTL